jgi:hypothetical protein
MQICVHDVFATKISSFTCHDMVSTYDTTITSLLINFCPHKIFVHIKLVDSYYVR